MLLRVLLASPRLGRSQPVVKLIEKADIQLSTLPPGAALFDWLAGSACDILIVDHELLESHDGRQALETVRALPDAPDVVLLHPPGVDAFDQAEWIGAGAVATLLAGTGHVMITRQNGRIVPIPFDELIDPKTGKTPVRMLDTTTEGFATAMKLQTRLEAGDLEDGPGAESIAAATNLDLAALRARFA